MKPARALANLLALVATALAASIALKCAADVSPMWDVWYYHLPFAARIFGIVPRDVYAFHATNEARYAGFPLLGEALQGLFWYLFRRPEAATFVAYGSVLAFVFYLKKVFRVSAVASTLALFAIPLVQTHASSCYVDLPANIAAAVVLLSIAEAFGARGVVPWAVLLRAAVAAAVAANMRLQLNPLVALALAALGIRAFLPLIRARSYAAAGRLALACLVALPIVFVSPLKNLVVHHNPVYPMSMTVAGVRLPGPEEVYSDAPPYLSRAPRVQRFVYSVFEVGIRPMADPRRWTVDQWMPPAATGNRMGGFFHAYVATHLAMLAWFAARDRSRAQRGALVTFGAVTLFAANAPQSHELRYYMFWMLLLVGMNLAALARCGRARADGGLALENAFSVAALVAVAVVATVTRFAYVVPSGYGFAELLRDKVSAETRAGIAEAGDGARVCVAKEPWTILYASAFHPPARYQVVEAESEAQCEGARFVP